MTAPTQRIAPADAPPIGQYWQGQGGIYAGIMPDYLGRDPQHLIFSAGEVVGVKWAEYLALDSGATSSFNGEANTRALVASEYWHPAAAWAAEYVKDGHADFHLPSRQEWDVASVTIPEQFAQGEWYWSSSEHSPTTAWGLNFISDDLQDDLQYRQKTSPGRVRAVRTVPA
jgi:hypothetical protein